MKLTDGQKFALLQTVSGMYLCEKFPDNWGQMTEDEQDAFIEQNKWAPMETYEVDEILNFIDNAYVSILETLDGFKE